MYEQVTKKLLSAETVALFVHINPDGDCVGSALATYAFLRNMGKRVFCYLEPGHVIRENLSFLPNIDAFNAPKLKSYDLGIALDCGGAGRLGSKSYQAFLTCEDHLCIDHHETSEPFVETTVLEPKAAATCQILYKVMREVAPEAIDLDVATCLFTGIASDSGALSFSSVTPESYRISAELSERGVNTYGINRRLFKDVDIRVFQLTLRVLNAAEFWQDGKVGVILFRKEDFDATNTCQSDTEGIINRIIDISCVKLAISVAQTDESTFKIGMRAKDEIDAGACAKYFGGGGHRAASGCRIYGTWESVCSDLKAMAEKFVK